jgi:hypothetical protein
MFECGKCFLETRSCEKDKARVIADLQLSADGAGNCHRNLKMLKRRETWENVLRKVLGLRKMWFVQQNKIVCQRNNEMQKASRVGWDHRRRLLHFAVLIVPQTIFFMVQFLCGQC